MHQYWTFANSCLLQTVVYSEGTLYLDDCDFSGSSAPVLVFAEREYSTVVRNAVLGDKNCELVCWFPATHQFPTGIWNQ